MDKDVQIVTRCVELQSYATSLGFLGFFERRHALSNALCERAINAVVDDPIFEAEDWSILSDLFILGDDAQMTKELGLRQQELSSYVYPLRS